MMDVVELAQRLIRCPSITPHDAGALDVIARAIKPLGFVCHRLVFGNGAEAIDNLFAYRAGCGPHICFAGHTDVVPVGDESLWAFPPFDAVVSDGLLYGRGAVDMKGAIAAFISAIADLVNHNQLPNAVSLMITGDEEGVAQNGTVKILEWVKRNNFVPDYCIVGEPTSEAIVGDTYKMGRRGSVNFNIIEKGTQGHAAYPEQADNPISRFVEFLRELSILSLDDGDESFSASQLQITSVDVGNMATNVIPGAVSAHINIRFNTHHTGEGLTQVISSYAEKHLKNFTMAAHCSANPFVTNNPALKKSMEDAIKDACGVLAVSKTTGGTSDARFIHNYCPVVEVGLLNASAHHVNESVCVEDLHSLKNIYINILKNYETLIV